VLAPLLLGHIVLHGAGVGSVIWLASTATHLVVLASVSVRFFGLARCDLRYLWLYPASALGVMLILLSALQIRAFRRSIDWRGTAYAVRPDGSVA
jgi:hypothetical protein